MDIYVLIAAGGNPTAIGVIDAPKKRSWYERAGRVIMEQIVASEIEQVGFLDVSNKHFEMAGGEFCCNGVRAAGCLLADITNGSNVVSLTCSGYPGKVSVEMIKRECGMTVTGVFPNLLITQKTFQLSEYGAVEVVDMGGIVHVVVNGDLPGEYISQQRLVVEECNLESREAVGVCWIGSQKDEGSVRINPVVWVRSINTCFFESACGSGSIAAAAATGVSDILQPTGESIIVDCKKDEYRITSSITYSGDVVRLPIDA